MEAFSVFVVVSLLGCALALPTPCLPIVPSKCVTPNTPYSFFSSVYESQYSYSYYSANVCAAVGIESIPEYIPTVLYEDIEEMMLQAKCKWLSSFSTYYPPNIANQLCNLPKEKLIYDFVMVYSGPGTLSALESLIEQGFRVALIEEGLFPPAVANSMYYRHSMLNSPFVKPYPAYIPGCNTPKKFYVPNCLGGVSVFDFNTWNYGSKSIYEKMAQFNDIFSWENAQSRYKKFERYEKTTTKTTETNVKVDACGCVSISKKVRETSVTRSISTVFQELGYGNGFTPLDIEQAPGLSIVPHIGSGGSKSLLYPQEIFKKLPCFDNIDLIMGLRIERLIYEHGRIAGVEVITNNGPIIIYARYDVILGCSSIPMFELLTRSGIGNPLYMNKFGIPIVSELPYLGQNLLVNPICINPFIRFPKGTLIDEYDTDFGSFDFIFGGSNLSEASSLSYYSAFLNVRQSQTSNIMMRFYTFTSSMSYRIQLTLYYYFQLDYETVQYVIEMCKYYDLLFIVPQLLSPKSIGTLEYGESLQDLRINLGMLSEEEDILTMIEALEFIEKIGKTSSFTSIGGEFMNLPVKSFPMMNGNFYSPECIRQWLPYSCIPNLHIGGGAIIGTEINNSVVNSNFYVHGITNLQCLSSAISPYPTYSDSIAFSSLIGRYGSEFILDRYNSGFYEKMSTSSSSSYDTVISGNGIGSIGSEFSETSISENEIRSMGYIPNKGIIPSIDTCGSNIDLLSGSSIDSTLSSSYEYGMGTREMEAISASKNILGGGGSSLSNIDIDVASSNNQLNSFVSNGISTSFSESESEALSYSSDVMTSSNGLNSMCSSDSSYAAAESVSGSTAVLGNGGMISEYEASQAEASSSSFQAVNAGYGGVQSVSQSASEAISSTYESSTMFGGC